ncbi:hypothetical protein ACTFIT_008165 [Dictyostelium discoideum]
MFENIKSLIFSAVSLLFSFLYYHSDSIISLFTQNLGEAVLETIDEVIHKPQTSLQQESLKLQYLVQGTKKWEEVREKYSFTGSRLAAAIGIDPYTSQHDLFHFLYTIVGMCIHDKYNFEDLFQRVGSGTSFAVIEEFMRGDLFPDIKNGCSEECGFKEENSCYFNYTPRLENNSSKFPDYPKENSQ